MNEVWKSIANYPSYEVSNLGNVRHLLKSGKIKTLKLNGRKAHLNKEGKRLTVSIGKLMYATFHNIELSRLTNISTTGDTLENLQLMVHDDFLSKIRSKSHGTFTPEIVERLQRECFEDIRAILDGWHTGNFSPILLRIESYKEDLIAYSCKRFELSRRTAEELWSEAVDALILNILEKRRSVSGFQGWLRVTMKHLYYQRRDKRKQEILFKENLFITT